VKPVVVITIAFVLLIPLLILPSFAESQTLPTDRGTLDVKLSYDKIIPEQITKLNIEFINPQTKKVQEHIDYKITVSKNGKTIFGPIALTHTSVGSVKIPVEFVDEGIYSVGLGVEGILFQPIPTETVYFDVVVGNSFAPSTKTVSSGDQNKTAKTEMKFYKNETYDYFFEMPSDWRVMEDMDNTKGIVFQTLIFPDGYNSLFPDGYNPLLNIDPPSISVVFLNIPKSDVAMLNEKNLEEYQREQVTEKIPYTKIIDSSSEKTDWGWKITVESKFSQNIHAIDTLFVFPDRESYTVRYLAIEENYFDLYKPVYDHVIKTMVINGVAVPEFGSIVMLILVISIISVILITRRFDVISF
jgi:predicted secreted protein with PEFG-CTERM motif